MQAAVSHPKLWQPKMPPGWGPYFRANFKSLLIHEGFFSGQLDEPTLSYPSSELALLSSQCGKYVIGKNHLVVKFEKCWIKENSRAFLNVGFLVEFNKLLYLLHLQEKLSHLACPELIDHCHRHLSFSALQQPTHILLLLGDLLVCRLGWVYYRGRSRSFLSYRAPQSRMGQVPDVFIWTWGPEWVQDGSGVRQQLLVASWPDCCS